MAESRLIETPTHGRVMVAPAASAPALGWVFAFHGYGQGAEEFLGDVARIPGVDRWHVASVQALHRFYARGDERVIASWMTRQDRDVTIADNIAYVDRAIGEIIPPGDASLPLVLLGFSQGVAMAYRAAAFGRRRAAGVVALGGDVPPEVASSSATLPPVLIGAGDKEQWYTAAKVDADLKALASKGVPHDVIRYAGGHEWTEQFRTAVSTWLLRVSTASPRA